VELREEEVDLDLEIIEVDLDLETIEAGFSKVLLLTLFHFSSEI
jgi:hypothetical protein